MNKICLSFLQDLSGLYLIAVHRRHNLREEKKSFPSPYSSKTTDSYGSVYCHTSEKGRGVAGQELGAKLRYPEEQKYTDKWWLNIAYPEDHITYLHLISRFLVRIR